jgi:hypothetical protein
MMAPLNTCTTTEQRGVVRFLWAKNMEGYPQRNAAHMGKKYGSKGYPQRNVAHMGKKYESKGYPQRNAAHMGSISFATSIFFAHKKCTTPRCPIVVHAFRGAAIL